jgi:DNA polymerase III subunit delta
LKIQPSGLKRHLDGGLAPIYLVAGDEPLLVGDVLDEIRGAARRAGFETREVHAVERGFRWDELLAGAENLSLFASRRILELRLPSPRPGDQGAKALRALAEHRDPDLLVIVAIDARLDSAAASSQWVKALERAGVQVDVRPVERAELPRWIRQRGARHGLSMTAEAAALLADRVEGHLLAADQELMKLALAGPRGEIGEAEVQESVADNARFDVFRLTDAVLEGDAPRAIRVLHGLRAEGVQPVLVSWALGREIGLLSALKFAQASGERLDGVYARHRVWPKRRALLERALGRYEWRFLAALLDRAVEVDGIVKGAAGMPPWDALTRLVVAMLEPGRARRPHAA